MSTSACWPGDGVNSRRVTPVTSAGGDGMSTNCLGQYRAPHLLGRTPPARYFRL